MCKEGTAEEHRHSDTQTTSIAVTHIHPLMCCYSPLPRCVSGIRILECILLKVSLLLGVEFYCPVEYTDLVEPHGDNGWRVKVRGGVGRRGGRGGRGRRGGEEGKGREEGCHYEDVIVRCCVAGCS